MPQKLFYNKEYKKPAELLETLKARGFDTQMSDEDICEILNNVSYFYLNRYRWQSNFFNYRDSKYILPNPNNDHMELLLERYYDDIKLKGILMKLIHVIEDSLKNTIIEFYGQTNPLFYRSFQFDTSGSNSPCTIQRNIQDIFTPIQQGKKPDSSNSGLIHFYKKYKGSNYDSESIYPPIWKLANALTFGQLIKMLKISSDTHANGQLQNFLESRYDGDAKFIHRRFSAVRWIRNICAHYENIIARGKDYYPQISKRNASQKDLRLYTCNNIGFLHENQYHQIKDPETNELTELMRVKKLRFAWYYEAIYLLLESIVKTTYQKNIINEYLKELEDITGKEGYQHLGFGSGAKYTL